MMDRLGKCPSCNTSWDGGDILENLKALNALTHRTEKDVMDIAKTMGYSMENKTRFTKVLVHEKGGNIVLECSNRFCGCKFDAVTGEPINY